MSWKHRTKVGAFHVAVAVGYAVCFAALREVSFAHWLVFSGFRLCALLFAPAKFWPALVVGEFIPSAYDGFQHASDYGWRWAVSTAFPSIILAMPVIHWYRQHKKLFRHPESVDMVALVQGMLLVSAIWTARNLVAMAITPLPADEAPIVWIDLAARWFIGNFLGVLTAVPMAVWVKECAAIAPKGLLLNTLAESRVLREGMFILVPVLLALVCLSLASDNASVQHIARMTMFLPMVWLAVHHGWPGAAIGGTAASVAVIAVAPVWESPGTLQAEMLVAFATTTMLLLGAHMSAQKDQHYREREERKLSQAATRRSLLVGEIQLRQMSAAVDDLREFVKLNHRHLIVHLQDLMPEMAQHPYVRQAAATQERLQQLSDGLYPVTWRHYGLPAALSEGALARALLELGVEYVCEIKGRGLRGLSADAHIAIYRLACEIVVQLCVDARVDTIRLRVRGGTHRGRRWVALLVDSHLEGERDSELYFADLQRRLAASGQAMEAIRLRADAFQGSARQHPTLKGQRIGVFLWDPES